MSAGIGGAPADQEDPRADLIWGTVPRLVEDAALRHGSAEALVDGELRLTYAQLAEEVDRYARAFMASGVAAGDRVAVWAPNCAEWMLAALGLLRAGGVLVPLNTRFKGGEAAYIIRNAGASTLVTVRGFLGVDYPALLAGQDTGDLARIILLRDEHDDGRSDAAGVTVPVTGLDAFLAAGEGVDPADVAARAAAVRSDDISDLIFTSGTTGHPKGASATHAQSLRTFGTWSSIVGLTAGDRYLVVNPFFHTFGYKAGILACVMAGATVVPEPVFDPSAVMARIGTEHISVLPGPPTLYQTLLSDPRRAEHDLSSLRLGVTGAAVVPVELVQAMRDELGFDTVLTAYGLTESCGTVTMCRRSDPPEIVAATSGRAIPGLEVRAVAAGTDVAPGEPGEDRRAGLHGDARLLGRRGGDGRGHRCRGLVAHRRYRRPRPGRQRHHHRPRQGHVRGRRLQCLPGGDRGDSARPRGGGPGGRRRRPGRPDGGGGLRLYRAYGGAAAAGTDPVELGRAILSWSRGAMANYKVPRGIVLVDALPVNASGKVLKRELRQRHADGADTVVTNES